MSNVYPEMATETCGSLLDSMFALISHARVLDVRDNLRPFLHVMVQLWMRELRRVLGKVDREHADLLLESDLNHARAERKEHYLPVVNCRDCGATGWAGLQDERGQIVVKDIKVFYNKYFAYDKHIRMVFPRRQNEGNSQMHQRYQFCPQCLYVQMEQTREGRCAACGHGTVPVWMPDIEVNKQAKSYVCPFCGGTHSLILVGLRSATAISAGISQLYGSHFNDNVQDASHRAGFFNARTCHSVHEEYAGGVERLAAQKNPHVHMEAVEENSNQVPQFAQTRHPGEVRMDGGDEQARLLVHRGNRGC